MIAALRWRVLQSAGPNTLSHGPACNQIISGSSRYLPRLGNQRRLLMSGGSPQQSNNTSSTGGSNLKELYRKYGRLAIGVYLTMSCTTFSMIYVAIWNGIDVQQVLQRYLGRDDNATDHPSGSGGDSHGQKSDSNNTRDSAASDMNSNETPARGDWSWDRVGTTFVVAFAANKLLTPIKFPLTAVLTPTIARWLKRRRG